MEKLNFYFIFKNLLLKIEPSEKHHSSTKILSVSVARGGGIFPLSTWLRTWHIYIYYFVQYIQKQTDFNELQFIRKLDDAFQWMLEKEANVKGTSLPTDLSGMRRLQRKHASIEKEIDEYEHEEVSSKHYTTQKTCSPVYSARFSIPTII